MTADPQKRWAVADALLPPLWRIVQSYGIKVEALMWSELPIFTAMTSTRLTQADMIETVGDPDADVALRWWHTNRNSRRFTQCNWGWGEFYIAVATSGNMAPLAWSCMYDRAHTAGSGMITRAIACGHANVVRWAVNVAYIGLPEGVEVDIARHGSADLLLEVDNKGNRARSTAGLEEAAAEFGDIGLLKLAISMRYEAAADIVPQMLRGASRSGKIETLEWIRASYPAAFMNGSGAVRDATNVAGLAWILENTSYVWRGDECNLYAAYGYLELIQYARAQGCPWEPSGQGCVRAAFYGHLETLKWMVGAGACFKHEYCDAVAENNGHTRVVEWIARLISS